MDDLSGSPLPPDPYSALGVSKDADTDTIKKAHRKLVLKHHPDRIKDPALVEQGKNEFQKVQQAYELLVDPTRRTRYDDEIKLAQLRKERMMSQRESARSNYQRPTTTTTYSTRPAPTSMPSAQREARPDARYAYEERTPDAYFEGLNNKVYEEPIPRGTTRKEPHEKRTAATRAPEKKEKPKASAWEKTTSGVPLRAAFGMKNAAAAAKKKVAEKDQHARNAKARDKAERSERLEKEARTRQTYAKPRVDPYSDAYSGSESDSDTVVAPGRKNMARERSPRPVTRERSPLPKTRERSPPVSTRRDRSPIPRSRRHLTPEPPRRRQVSPRRSSVSDAEGYDTPDEWEEHHEKAQEYIRRSHIESSRGAPPAGRPPLQRQNSEQKYWASSETARDHHRSGSDSDRQRNTPGSHSRRSAPREDPEPVRRPGLYPHSSAPAGMKAQLRNLDTQAPSREVPLTRARQGSYDSRVPGHRQNLFGEFQPGLQRTNSDPISPKTTSKRDAAPAKPSTLKQSVKQSDTNHDSGYSSSSPNTETRGLSPEPQPPLQRRETATKYRVKKNEDDSHHRARKVSDEAEKASKYLSPESAAPTYYAEERGERRHSRSPEGRSRSNRPTAERRPSFSRTASNSRYEERPRAAPKTVERSPERAYSRKVDLNEARFTPNRGRPAVAPRYDDVYRTEAATHRATRGRKASVF